MEYVFIFALFFCTNTTTDNRYVYLCCFSHALIWYYISTFAVIDIHLLIHTQNMLDLLLFFGISFFWENPWGKFWKSVLFGYIMVLGLLFHFPIQNIVGVFILNYGHVVLHEMIILIATWNLKKDKRNAALLACIFCVYLTKFI